VKVLDTVWMVVLPGQKGIVYEVGKSAREVWEKVLTNETLGTGVTRPLLHKQGYRAKRVSIAIKG
jgi:hypothetical protein